MKPRKIIACISPGFQSRRIMRACRKPFVKTLLARASGWSHRTSGASAATIASLRQASHAKAAIATNMSSEIPRGLIVGGRIGRRAFREIRRGVQRSRIIQFTIRRKGLTAAPMIVVNAGSTGKPWVRRAK